jgi:hypothetical protein
MVVIKVRENGQGVFLEREKFQVHPYETGKVDVTEGPCVGSCVHAENDDGKGKFVAVIAVNERVMCGMHLLNQGKQEVSDGKGVRGSWPN